MDTKLPIQYMLDNCGGHGLDMMVEADVHYYIENNVLLQWHYANGHVVVQEFRDGFVMDILEVSYLNELDRHIETDEQLNWLYLNDKEKLEYCRYYLGGNWYASEEYWWAIPTVQEWMLAKAGSTKIQ